MRVGEETSLLDELLSVDRRLLASCPEQLMVLVVDTILAGPQITGVSSVWPSTME